MLKIKIFCVFFMFLISFFPNSLHAYVANVQTRMDINGNAISVWQDDLNKGQFNIFASILLAGQKWTTPVNISLESGTNNNIPKIAFNNNGNAIIVWTGYNEEVALTSLYGITLSDYKNWSSVRQISKNSEQVNENINVTLSDMDDYVITWSGYSFQKSIAVIQSVSSKFGNWSEPETIAF